MSFIVTANKLPGWFATRAMKERERKKQGECVVADKCNEKEREKEKKKQDEFVVADKSNEKEREKQCQFIVADKSTCHSRCRVPELSGSTENNRSYERTAAHKVDDTNENDLLRFTASVIAHCFRPHKNKEKKRQQFQKESEEKDLLY